MRAKPLVHPCDPIRQNDAVVPSQVVQAADIEQLSRRAVGLV